MILRKVSTLGTNLGTIGTLGALGTLILEAP